MKPKAHPKPHPRHKATPALDSEPSADGSGDAGEVIERPDGFYWQPWDRQPEVGPFETYELAQASRDAVGDEVLDRGESLLEAEREIGINDWIDAETGEPAEGQSPPHLEEE